jgi:hypothetical protein
MRCSKSAANIAAICRGAAMSRHNVRTMNRSVAAGSRTSASAEASSLARQSALHLLERSIRFGHHRLAIVRLATAVKIGAEPSDDHWAYCSRVADGSRDEALRLLFRGAAQASSPVDVCVVDLRRVDPHSVDARPVDSRPIDSITQPQH